MKYESRQMLAPSYGISACVIYKNFSTILTSIICYLFDSLKYKQNVADMMKDTYQYRFCQNKNEYYSFNIHKTIKPRVDRAWTHYLILRNPLERFVSGFVNKCIFDVVATRKNPCYGCGANLTCVMEAQYNSLMRASRSGKAPRHCELGEFYRSYRKLKYSPATTSHLLDDLLNDFQYLGVPQNITDDIRNQIMNGKTFHTTFDTPERVKYTQMIEESPYLTELLVKMFYYDYLFFEYPLPEIL